MALRYACVLTGPKVRGDNFPITLGTQAKDKQAFTDTGVERPQHVSQPVRLFDIPIVQYQSHSIMAVVISCMVQSLMHLLRSHYALAALLALPSYFLSTIIYNVYFHPLRTYSGPWLARATSLPWIFYQVCGRLPHALKAWHDRHGSAVRVAPNTLSYTESQAWFDIHGIYD
jgi:hypothetical protein